MRERLAWLGRFALGALIIGLLVFLIYQIPAVQSQLEWRLDAAAGIVRGWIYPGDTLPTPATPVTLPTRSATRTPTTTASAEIDVTPLPTPTPLPSSVRLPTPDYEKQDWNNCGPAALSLGLRFYGWNGDQFDISSLLKPDRGDKNVSVWELVYYVRTQAGWLGVVDRVGGDLEILKRFLANGFAVIVEKSFELDPDQGGGGWTGHYLLLTGYDDAEQAFVSQDTYHGPDRWISYQELDDGWRAFNRVFIVVYPLDRADEVEALLGVDADEDVNRQRALEAARLEIEADAGNAFAWANLGANLLHFERYTEAAEAYDTALTLGLPWRFTRHQFGPYIAYYNVGRFEDVITLTETTLHRAPKAEEALLWHGWASFQLGYVQTAIDDFRAALRVNPNYIDAQYGLEFLGVGP
jgi:hypothetical protein